MKNNNLKDGKVDICRVTVLEKLSRIPKISDCSHLANGEHFKRYKQLARTVHQQLELKYELVNSKFDS